MKYVHPGEFEAFVDESSEETRNLAYRQKYNAISDMRKANRAIFDAQNPLGKFEYQHAWSPQGYIGNWVCQNQAVVKVQSYLFAHGGFSQEYTSFSLDEINSAAQMALKAQNWEKDSILRDKLGLLWYRGNVRGRKDSSGFSREAELIKVLDRYQATHIIVGHTRNESGIKMSADGRLIQIDTGATAHYGGVPSFLRIEDGQIYAHTLNGFEILNESK